MYQSLHEFNPKSRVPLGRKDFKPPTPYGQKNSSYYSRRPGPERIALLVSMINQAGRSSCDGTFPVPLINICADCEPSACCPVDFMPLPSRGTSADIPVVLDTALLLCSFLLPAAKELGLNPKPRHFKPFEYFDHTGCTLLGALRVYRWVNLVQCNSK